MSNSQAIAAIMSAIALGATSAAVLSNREPTLDEMRQAVAIADAPPLVAAADAPELLAAVPPMPGRLLECDEAVARIDPGTPQERLATARCDWDVDGQRVRVWLQHEHAAKVRKVKDDKARASNP